MNVFEMNKIIGAILGTLVLVMGIGFLANAIYAPIEGRGPGYNLPVPEGVGGESVEPEAVVEATPLSVLLASASAEGGAGVARKCAACHSFEEGGANKVGPALYGIVGASIGGVEGFGYSDTLSQLGAEGGTWSYESLNAFLTSPKEFAPGTKMSFAGLRKEDDRADMLAYMQALSANPVPFPADDSAATEAAPVAEVTSEAAVEPASEAAVEPAPAQDTPAEAAPQTPVEEAVSAATDTASEAVQAGTDTPAATNEAASEAVNDASEAVTDAASEATQAATETAADTVSDGVTEAVDTAAVATEAVIDTATEASEAAPETATEAVTDTATQAGDAVSETAPADQSPALFTLLANASVDQGIREARKCAACHSFDEGGSNKVGPALYDIVGSPIGSNETFKYSDVFKEMNANGDVWTYETLATFLAKPRDFAPGTKMAFAGLRKEQQIADLIAHMRTLSNDPVPLP